ncbi:helix-turn-helix domain-containing protein [Mycoplasma struthionis]|uniref:helix-turn-helix domain-containing protein n=1 Tax=Mycoplasma struthionis TaxID=538220 RepID=UPI001B87205D|nr:helix-turn-helix transcriptional regulator [Mycoplasma struthionis]
MNYNYKRLIKTLRNKLVLTQEELASLLNVSFASINRWEAGRHEPTTKIKKKIIELCKQNGIELIMEEIEYE